MLLSWGDSRPWSFPKGEQCLLRLCPEGGGGGGGDVSKQLSRRSPYKAIKQVSWGGGGGGGVLICPGTNC